MPSDSFRSPLLPDSLCFLPTPSESFRVLPSPSESFRVLSIPSDCFGQVSALLEQQQLLLDALGVSVHPNGLPSGGAHAPPHALGAGSRSAEASPARAVVRAAAKRAKSPARGVGFLQVGGQTPSRPGAPRSLETWTKRPPMAAPTEAAALAGVTAEAAGATAAAVTPPQSLFDPLSEPSRASAAAPRAETDAEADAAAAPEGEADAAPEAADAAWALQLDNFANPNPSRRAVRVSQPPVRSVGDRAAAAAAIDAAAAAAADARNDAFAEAPPRRRAGTTTVRCRPAARPAPAASEAQDTAMADVYAPVPAPRPHARVAADDYLPSRAADYAPSFPAAGSDYAPSRALPGASASRRVECRTRRPAVPSFGAADDLPPPSHAFARADMSRDMGLTPRGGGGATPRSSVVRMQPRAATRTAGGGGGYEVLGRGGGGDRGAAAVAASLVRQYYDDEGDA